MENNILKALGFIIAIVVLIIVMKMKRDDKK
jgi:hypothetical protein